MIRVCDYLQSMSATVLISLCVVFTDGIYCPGLLLVKYNTKDLLFLFTAKFSAGILQLGKVW